MPAAEKLATTVSSEGQVVLPEAIRRQRDWPPGTRLVIKARPDGVMLRREEPFIKPTRIEDVAGMLAGPGPILTAEGTDEAIASEMRRHARD